MAVAVVAIEVKRYYVLYDIYRSRWNSFHRTVFCLRYELRLKIQLSI